MIKSKILPRKNLKIMLKMRKEKFQRKENILGIVSTEGGILR